MKVVHLSAFEQRGGAAIAASRLHRGQRAAGMDSEMLVQFKASDASHVHGPRGKWAKAMALFRDTTAALPQLLYPQRASTVFSSNGFPSMINRRVAAHDPDLVHLHWLHAGMLSVSDLGRFTQPLVWTLHDMWPFTGGCHYAGDCVAYQHRCGGCPQLGSARQRDLSRQVLGRKRRKWAGLNFTPVAPSRWLAESAAKSSLFGGLDIRVIPNGLDLSMWRPVEAAKARQLLNLPDGPLLLFSAARGLEAQFKGGTDLLGVLNSLHAAGQRFTLMVMGNSELPKTLRADFPVHGLGELHDEISRVLAFSAADITLHSAGQDNLPNTIAESLACGTPVVAKAIGGIPEMITDCDNGLLVSPSDDAAYAQALTWFLSDADRHAMARAARYSADNRYDIVKVVDEYRALYEELLEARRGQQG